MYCNLAKNTKYLRVTQYNIHYRHLERKYFAVEENYLLN
jgi:hypothetical protein